MTMFMSPSRRIPLATSSLLVISLWLPGAALAQLPDLFEASVQYMPGVELEDPKPAEAQVASYDVSLNVPLPLGVKTFLIPGAAYHVDAVSFENTPPNFTDLRAFHSIELPILLVQLLPREWAISLRIAPGVAGDFQAFDGGLVRVSGLALATHSFSERFVLGGGAIGSYAFGSFLLLPAAYLEWKPVAALALETFLPAFATVKYTFGDRVEVGLRADIGGNSYAVRDERIAGAWPCAASASDDPGTPEDETRADPARCFDHAAYSVATAGATVGVRLFGSVWWSVYAGHSFFRRFEQLNDVDEQIPGGVQDLPNTYFVRTSFTVRIPRE
jgi:hypothetical protein